MPSPGPEADIPPPRRRTWPLVAVVILLLSLGLSITAALLRGSTVHEQERDDFRATASDITGTIAVGLRSDADFMTTLSALIAMEPHLTATQFNHWYSGLHSGRSQVGGLVTAVISVVPARRLQTFLDQRMADPAFRKLAGNSNEITPPGRRARYCLLSAIVSRLPESALIQLATHADWCQSAISGTARVINNEAENGQLSISPPMLGTSYIGTAVYRHGVPLQTATQRRSAVIAWIWSSLDVPAVIRTAIGSHRGFAVTLYHRDPLYGMQLIGSGGTPRGTHGLGYRTHIDIGGRWTVQVTGRPSISGLSGTAQAWFVFTVGLLITILLATLAAVLMRSRERALGLVDERTGQLRHQALHDALTGLPNRVLAMDRAEQMLARARREHVPLAALYIDLDGFKHINDTFGHAAGDEVLRILAGRLATVIREDDTAARLGGDEFVVLVQGATLDASPELIAERLLGVLREPYDLNGEIGRQLSLTASIGIAVGLRRSADQLLRDADVALHQAKLSGKNRHIVFRSSMQTAAQDRLTLEMDLAEAIERDELFLLYQPIYDLRSETVVGAEALVRWRHPRRGVVSPADFIPITEDTGLIVPVGRWVLEHACRQAAKWHAEGRRLDIAVNVSARQLDANSLVDDVGRALQDSGLAPTSLTVEITETALMRDAEATARRLQKLKQLGVRIAIDDFGTGYSSLAYLRQFPVDALKIDRAFIDGIETSKEQAALIHTLVQLGKTLQLETLAEGVQDSGQLAVLQREGCDFGQGFLFAPPLEPHALEELVGLSVSQVRVYTNGTPAPAREERPPSLPSVARTPE